MNVNECAKAQTNVGTAKDMVERRRCNRESRGGPECMPEYEFRLTNRSSVRTALFLFSNFLIFVGRLRYNQWPFSMRGNVRYSEEMHEPGFRIRLKGCSYIGWIDSEKLDG